MRARREARRSEKGGDQDADGNRMSCLSHRCGSDGFKTWRQVVARECRHELAPVVPRCCPTQLIVMSAVAIGSLGRCGANWRTTTAPLAQIRANDRPPDQQEQLNAFGWIGLSWRYIGPGFLEARCFECPPAKCGSCGGGETAPRTPPAQDSRGSKPLRAEPR